MTVINDGTNHKATAAATHVEVKTDLVQEHPLRLEHRRPERIPRLLRAATQTTHTYLRERSGIGYSAHASA